MDITEYLSKKLCAVKVTVGRIEFVLFIMYLPGDNGYVSHDLVEYVVLIGGSDICNKSASQYFVFGVLLKQTYLSPDAPQTRALRSFVNDE